MHQLNNVISPGNDHVEFTLAYISKQAMLDQPHIYFSYLHELDGHSPLQQLWSPTQLLQTETFIAFLQLRQFI